MPSRFARFLVATQVGMSVFGLVLVFGVGIADPAYRALTPLLQLAFAAAIYALGLWAGLAAWRGQVRGYRVSAVLEALQLVQVSTAHSTFAVLLGFQVLLVLNGSTITFSPGIRSYIWLGPVVTGTQGWSFSTDLLSFITVPLYLKTAHSLMRLSAPPDGPNAPAL